MAGRSVGEAVAVAVVGPLLLLGAGSDDQPPTVVQPTSAFEPAGSTRLTGSTGSTEATGASGATGTIDLPTTTPGSATGNVTSGQAAVTLTGDVRASKTLPDLVSGVYAPAPGSMVLVWTAGGTDATTIGLGGLTFTGTRPTSPALSITITVQAKGSISTFISSAGECAITIGVASADQLSGAFDCADLPGGSGAVVNATGSFGAQG